MCKSLVCDMMECVRFGVVCSMMESVRFGVVCGMIECVGCDLWLHGIVHVLAWSVA